MEKLLFSAGEGISYEVVNAQAIITISRPPHNWLGLRELIRLCEILNELRWECPPKAKRVDAIIIQQAQEIKNFCVGFELKDHRYPVFPAMLAQMHHLFWMMSEIEIPIIAVVRGKALGGGAELALMCDKVIASEDSGFSFPEVMLNVFPPFAAAVFPRMSPDKETYETLMELLFKGTAIGCEQAKELGIVDFAFSSDLPKDNLPGAEIDSVLKDWSKRNDLFNCGPFANKSLSSSGFLRKMEGEFSGERRAVFNALCTSIGESHVRTSKVTLAFSQANEHYRTLMSHDLPNSSIEGAIIQMRERAAQKS